MLKKDALKIIKIELDRNWNLNWKQPCSAFVFCRNTRPGPTVWGHTDVTSRREISLNIHPIKAQDYDLLTDVTLHEIAHAKFMESVNFNKRRMSAYNGHNPTWEEMFIELCEKYGHELKPKFKMISGLDGILTDNKKILLRR